MALISATKRVFNRRCFNLAALTIGGLGLMMTSAACTQARLSPKAEPLPTYTTYYPDQNYVRPEAIGDTVRISGLDRELATSRAGQALLEKYGYWDSQGSGFKPAASYQHLSAVEESLSSQAAAKPLHASGGLTERVLITAYSQSGKNHRAGGKSPETGFDAPGFAYWVYRQNGVRVGQSIKDMMSSGSPVTRDNLRPGDLLIYRDPGRPDQHHVGIYTGAGNFIHAPKAGGTITESAAFGPQYESLFVTARRLYNDPKSAPLSRQRKNEITSEAIKTALSQKSFASSSSAKTKIVASQNKTPIAKAASTKTNGKKPRTRYKTRTPR